MNELIKNTEEKMIKTLGVLDRDYKAIRAGRANISVLDRITVDYYGSPTPIQQMAAVSVPEPRILMIQPWDASTLKDIEKAIPFDGPMIQNFFNHRNCFSISGRFSRIPGKIDAGFGCIFQRFGI